MVKRFAKPLPKAIDWHALMQAARDAKRRAYAPYSKFRVGAAVLGESGRIYAGCNLENSSYGLSHCAERNAIGRAIVDGEKRILAVAITANARPCPPCGACRQVIAEFAGPDTPIVSFGDRERIVHALGDLLPHAFDSTFL